jgi:NADH-ubiquinone oxidoreductase chain 2
LLALGISSVESTQAFLFYLTQYIMSNLNIFIILVGIGFSLYCYTSDNKEYEELMDKTNSPIQLVSQLKGYFYINPILSLSLSITIFSFVGIPPLVGFFAKQMVLSAALDSGFVFLALIAILTSVISAVYYLNIIKQMFFFKGEYLENITDPKEAQKETIKSENVDSITISSHMSVTISILTLVVFLFIFMANE